MPGVPGKPYCGHHGSNRHRTRLSALQPRKTQIYAVEKPVAAGGAPVVPAMVASSQGSMKTTRPSAVLGTIMPRFCSGE